MAPGRKFEASLHKVRCVTGAIAVMFGVLGALIYAAGGAYLGAMNAGWIDGIGESNPVLGVLGIGAGLVVLAFVRSAFNRRLGHVGGVGRAAQALLVLGPVMYVASWLIDFAIFGTLSLGAGLICLAITATRHRLGGHVDRVLIGMSAVGSLMWNTETTSAFLLVGVGLAWAVLSVRLLASAPAELTSGDPEAIAA